MKREIIIAACLAAVLPGVASAGGCEALGEVYRIASDAERKIQEQVLDPMLEMGKSYAFLEAKAELKASSEEEEKTGVGETSKKMQGEKGAGKGEDAANLQEQRAKQSKGSMERKETFRLELRSMKLRVLHDSSLSADRLKAVKAALLELFPEKLKAEDIIFVPARFRSEGFSEASAG